VRMSLCSCWDRNGSLRILHHVHNCGCRFKSTDSERRRIRRELSQLPVERDEWVSIPDVISELDLTDEVPASGDLPSSTLTTSILSSTDLEDATLLSVASSFVSSPTESFLEPTPLSAISASPNLPPQTAVTESDDDGFMPVTPSLSSHPISSYFLDTTAGMATWCPSNRSRNGIVSVMSLLFDTVSPSERGSR